MPDYRFTISGEKSAMSREFGTEDSGGPRVSRSSRTAPSIGMSPMTRRARMLHMPLTAAVGR